MHTEKEEKVLDNLSTAEMVARKMTGKYGGAYFDDVKSYAHFGLILAARSFDDNRGCSFQTYATHCMKGAIIDGLRGEKVIRRIRSKVLLQKIEDRQKNVLDQLSVKPGTSIMNDIYVEHSTMLDVRMVSLESLPGTTVTQGSPAEVLEEKIDGHKKRKMIIRALKKLPQGMQKILMQHYFGNKSLKEAGKKLKFSKSWSSRLHERALICLAENRELRALATC